MLAVALLTGAARAGIVDASYAAQLRHTDFRRNENVAIFKSDAAPAGDAADSADAALLRAALAENPGDREGLERLAEGFFESGNLRQAELAYVHLVGLVLDYPAEALPYALRLWHVRQNYEAQSGMLRLVHGGKLTPGNSRLLQRTLDELYAANSVVAGLRLDFPGDRDAPRLAALDEAWTAFVVQTQALEQARDEAGLRGALARTLGAPQLQAMYSLWRCFSLIHEGDPDGAELELGIAAAVINDGRLAMDLATASTLVSGVRRSPLSNELLNRFSELYSQAASRAEETFTENYVSVSDRFKAVREMIEERRFVAAAAELDSLHPLLTDESRIATYIYLRAETSWGLEEYYRANQGFIASSLLLNERFSVAASLYRMAEYAVMIDRKDDAVAYAVRSAGLLRDQAWKLRQTGNFFLNLEMPERGIAYLERSLDASESMAGDADSYAALARAYLHIGERGRYLEYAAEYVEAIDEILAVGNEISPDQHGMQYFFRGELLAEEGKPDEAYKAYEQASELLEERFRLAETLMIMADYQANAGNLDKAEELATRSADLLPEQAWKSRQIGNLLLRMGRTARGIRYLERALEHTPSVQDRAVSYASLADAYKGLDDIERYFFYAREYINLVKAHREMLTDAEEGLAAFYQGEIHAYYGDHNLSYAEYERAVSLLDNRFKRSDALMKMAQYQAERGNRTRAGELADASAAEIPDQAWKLKQAGDFFLLIDFPDKALEYYSRLARMTAPDDVGAAFAVVADAYKNLNRPELYMRYARAYIDAVHADGRTATGPEEGLAAYYEGEILAMTGEPEQAYSAYERASRLLVDKSRLADTFLIMAQHRAKDDAEGAAALAERAAEVYPEAGTLRAVGDFLMRLGMPDRALAFFERYTAEVSLSQSRTAVFSVVAEAYKKSGETERYLDFARQYVDAVNTPGYAATEAEQGLAAYYAGELAVAADDKAPAYAAYERASTIITEPFRLSEMYLKMARIQADLGNAERAATLAERSAAALPNEAWRLRQVGDLLLDLGMEDRAYEYIRRTVAQSSTEADRLAVYASWAESYNRANNQERYLQFAEAFVKTFDDDAESFSQDNAGLAAFYRGEIQTARGEAEAAYASYEQATTLLQNPNRLAEAFMKMATYQFEQGDRELAADLADKSARALPGQGWKQRQVGDLFVRLDMPERALEYYRRYFADGGSAEAGELAAYSLLAETYRTQRREDVYLRFAEHYVKAVEGKDQPTPDEAGLAALYRGDIHRHHGRTETAYAAYEEAARLFVDNRRKAEVLMKMAVIDADRGNREDAIRLTKQSLELLPDEEGRMQQAADMFVRLNDPEQAVELYERQLLLADTPRKQATAHMKLADVYRRLGDDVRYFEHAGAYTRLIDANAFQPSTEEDGLRYYYLGDYLASQNRQDEAMEAYVKAVELMTGPHRRAEALMKLANIEAARGNIEAAADLTERSLALIPDEDWKIQQAADMFTRLGLPDRALAMYERRLRQADSPRRQADALLRLADFHRRQGDVEKYSEYITAYADLVGSTAYDPTPDEAGMRLLLLGDLDLYNGRPDEALADYEAAAKTFANAARRADAMMKAANLRATRGDTAEAAALADEAARLFPDDHARITEVARLFTRLGNPEKAAEYHMRRLDSARSPEAKADIIATITEVYKREREQERYLHFARMYVETVRADIPSPRPDMEALVQFYAAEIAATAGNRADAVLAYVRASELTRDKYRAAESLMKAARLEAELGNDDAADALAERSVAALPGEAWKLLEAGYFFSNRGRMDKAMAYFERAVDLNPSPDSRANTYRAIADAFRRTGDNALFREYVTRYIAAIQEKGDAATPDDLGQVAAYEGELHALDGDDQAAYLAYERAAGLFTAPERVFDMVMRMANHQAKEGNTDQAAALAEHAAAIMPGDGGRQRTVGDFFLNLDMLDRALAYYDRQLALAANEHERAAAHAARAAAYLRVKDNDGYIEYAQRYIDAIALLGDAATVTEQGTSAYYQAEIHRLEDRPDAAYREYARAAELLTEPMRLSEIYVKMARHNATIGNHDLAARQAVYAADLVPDRNWRVAEAATVLSELQRYDDAAAVLKRAISLNPRDNAGLYRNLALVYVKAGRKRDAIRADEMYIDHLYARNDQYGLRGQLTEKHIWDLWNARNYHANLTKPLPFNVESYIFGRRYQHSDDYFLGMSTELFRNFRLKNGMTGKYYVIFSGTLSSFFSGTYQTNSGTGRWESRNHLDQTSQLLVGVSVNPFSWRWLSSLSFKAEYLFGLGTNVEDDFRFRMTFDRSHGHLPRPIGRQWNYWKIYSNTTYSTRWSNLSSAGYVRQGRTFVWREGGSFLTIPYASLHYDFTGRKDARGKRIDSGDQWGADFSLGVSFKKFVGATRYRTPRESVELDLYYLWGLTNGRRHGPGFTLSLKF